MRNQRSSRAPLCLGTDDGKWVARTVSMIVKAEGPSGRAKIQSDDPKHALGLVQYLRTIGYDAWIEDTNGKEIDERALKMATRSHHEDAPSS